MHVIVTDPISPHVCYETEPFLHMPVKTLSLFLHKYVMTLSPHACYVTEPNPPHACYDTEPISPQACYDNELIPPHACYDLWH